MNSAVVTSWDPGLIVLSFLFACVGSFIALTAAHRLRTRHGRMDWTRLLTIGAALGGVGVWSMHFIGMLALRMDVGSSYSVPETITSLALAVIATAGSVALAASRPDSLGRLLLAGVLLGLSVVVMHYLGMFGLKIYGFISWDMALVGLSILIAIVAATAALWLALNTPTLKRRLAAAVAMGVAVCAMHYTGMAAAEFICTTDQRTAIPQGATLISAFRLPSMVVSATVLMTLLLSLGQIFQRARSGKPAH
jgi:NO-binding membrane sensor protein with MHYT domain